MTETTYGVIMSFNLEKRGSVGKIVPHTIVKVFALISFLVLLRAMGSSVVKVKAVLEPAMKLIRRI